MNQRAAGRKHRPHPAADGGGDMARLPAATSYRECIRCPCALVACRLLVEKPHKNAIKKSHQKKEKRKEVPVDRHLPHLVAICQMYVAFIFFPLSAPCIAHPAPIAIWPMGTPRTAGRVVFVLDLDLRAGGGLSIALRPVRVVLGRALHLLGTRVVDHVTQDSFLQQRTHVGDEGLKPQRIVLCDR
jgi:hypothetical protein